MVSVDILADDEYSHDAMVVVPDDQLSLAIGREGQNVRLAHKLTGWKIDIKSVSQMEKAEAQNIQQYREEPVEDEIEEENDELKAEIEEEMNQQAYDEEDIQHEEPAEEEISEDE